MHRLSLLALALLVSLGASCFSAFADDTDTCVKAAGDERIVACSRVITAGKGNLSWAYYNRGLAYQEKGDIKDARRCYKSCISEGKRGSKADCAAMLR